MLLLTKMAQKEIVKFGHNRYLMLLVNGIDKIGVVKCDENHNYLEIHACYCIYWDQDTKKSVVGSCILTCFYTRSSIPFYPIERYSISNGTLFNEAVCSPSTSYVDTHREGRFCGRCKPRTDWQHTPINTPSAWVKEDIFDQGGGGGGAQQTCSQRLL